MRDLGVAFALALVIEGVLYFAFPDGMRRAVAAMAALPKAHVRATALVVSLVGLGLIWLLRRGIH
jgi:uncharacterized protein YjeT (DUF2065 family)